jgi:PAS domain S-box-containing protein
MRLSNLRALRALCLLVLFAALNAVSDAEEARPKRVLIISTGSRFSPGFTLVDQGVLEALGKIPSVQVETYAENLDILRFPTERFQRIFTEYLTEKYADQHPDLVILVFVGNLGIAGKLLQQLFPGTPVIVAGFTEEEVRTGQFNSLVSGLAQRVDPSATLELILRLQPETRRIVVIGGTAEVDRTVLKRVKEVARAFVERIEFDFWDNRGMPELSRAVSALPSQTVILFSRMFRDGAGRAVISTEAGRSIAQWSNVPVYVMTDTVLGTGAIGGSVASVEAFGKRAGELARLILSGTAPASLPFEIRTDSVPTFDWRALKRWGISESRLPPGSAVRFKPLSIWEQYFWYIIAALVIIVIQAAMIIDLLLHRARWRRVEAELRESRQLMELATTAGDLGLWSRDLTGGGIWANAPMRSLFGFSAQDVLRFDDLIARVSPSDRERMLSEVEQAQAAGSPFQGEFRVLLPNGTERWVLAKGRAMAASSGDARRMGVVLDITELKRAEEKFRIAVEASPNAIVMVNNRGRILLLNAQAEKLFGYAREELVGQSVEILIPERFRNAHPADHAGFLAAPQDPPTGAGRELLGLCKDGSEVPIEIGLSPIHTAEGLITLTTIIDISERKRSAEALEKERKFLRQVIDIDPNFIFAKDREGRFTLANKTVADAYGTTVENLIGKTDADYNLNRDEVEFFRRLDREVIDTLQERFLPEERLTDAHGNVHWLQTVKRPIVAADGSGHQVLGASTDITRRKETELELQEQRAELAHVARISTMGELAASLAHELNQPLTAILSNAQAALRFMNNKPADLEEVREILQDIVKDNSRAGEVIRRMRALVKKEELEFTSLDLASLIRDVVALVHSDAILQNVRIALELDDILPPVRGDKVQLQQVVLNLLLNAFDAMKDCPPGEREVKLRVECNGASLIQTTLSDRGTGLSGDKLDKIFQPFYSTKAEGLGMGLSICRSIVQAHGGHLWAENNFNRGATFYFTVPVEVRDEGRRMHVEGRETKDTERPSVGGRAR